MRKPIRFTGTRVLTFTHSSQRVKFTFGIVPLYWVRNIRSFLLKIGQAVALIAFISEPYEPTSTFGRFL